MIKVLGMDVDEWKSGFDVSGIKVGDVLVGMRKPDDAKSVTFFDGKIPYIVRAVRPDCLVFETLGRDPHKRGRGRDGMVATVKYGRGGTWLYGESPIILSADHDSRSPNTHATLTSLRDQLNQLGAQA